MPDQKYSKAALENMYKHGRAILSPIRFGEKKRSFQFIGFALGALTPITVAQFFNVSIQGWIIYLILGLGVIVAALGAVFMTSIFSANFVCDESLQDPLFDHLPRR